MISRQMGVAMTIALGLVVSASTHAADLQSVDAVLARMAQRDAGETHQARENDSDAALMKDIAAFRSSSAQLKATDAAAQWLALWDRAVARHGSDDEYDEAAEDPVTREMVGLGSLLASLPDPQAWPAIRAQSVARAAKAPKDMHALGLRLLADVLARDADAARKTLTTFERMASTEGPDGEDPRLSAIRDVRELVDEIYGSREQMAEAFRASVLLHEQLGSPYEVNAPDLVSLVGEAKAEALLLEALAKPVKLRVLQGEATKSLARKLALREVAHLRKPQWALVDDIGTAALYEALQARFGAGEGSPDKADDETPGLKIPGLSGRSLADVYYMLDMVVAGRRAEAEAAMLRLGDDPQWLLYRRPAMAELARRGQAGAVLAFTADMLARRPQLPLWDFHLEQSAAHGRSKEAIALLDRVLKRTDLGDQLRDGLMSRRIDALLADDQVDAAAAGLRALLAAPPSRNEPGLNHRMAAALKLAGLGRVMKRPQWSKVGLDFATKVVALPVSRQQAPGPDMSQPLVAELRRQGQADRAQALLLAQLESERANTAYTGSAALMVNPARRAALVELVGLYDAAGRSADVRRMLDEVPGWGALDLGEFAATQDAMGTPIGLMAARALKAAGNAAGAAAAARDVVMQLPRHDPAYQLWVELAGESAIAELDRMAAADPFEERPLVWKAVVLSRAGQHAAAEESVRRAIDIDPSDGEQGTNDRLRAYAVLADVLEAKGDANSAQGYRRAVAAIRMSEQADELHKLGLYQRAFTGYRAALAEFSDAYCIQSRLAVQLGKLGFNEEALKHYRRAFELMPDSFGRVESHCFGCESVFAGPTAQSVAEEVFSGLLKADTIKPQVPYMLGYLRKSQGRYDEAVTLFRRAIGQDALYLNAWRQLSELSEETYVDPAERDIARLRLFELDPRQRHVRYQLDEVGDLPGLWRAVTAFNATRAKAAKPAPIYPLAASVRLQQEVLASLPPEERSEAEKHSAGQNLVPRSGWDPRPPFNLADHRLLNATVRLMELEAR